MPKDALIYSGDDLINVPLPEGTRVLYPPPPTPPLPDPLRTLNDALDHPCAMKPLSGLVRPDSVVTIAFDDPCLPLPPMGKDIRGPVIGAVIDRLLSLGVRRKNIRLICANGLHRKWTRRELTKILGSRLVRDFGNGQLTCHDAEDKESMVSLGATPQGCEVEVNRAVSESDLLIYVAVTWTSMNGGWKSVLVGLGSYRSIRHHHNLNILEQGTLFEPERSAFHRVLHDMAVCLKGKAAIFKVEVVLNNEVWAPMLRGLLTPGERPLSPLMKFSRYLPRAIKDAARRGMTSGYKPIGMFAGDPEDVHRRALEALYRQQNLRVDGQADVLVLGVPNLSPYSAFSRMNPLLVFNIILGYMFNFHRGRPLARKGGVLIAFNPCRRDFHPVHHPSYIEFFEKILPEAVMDDPIRLESRWADDLACRKEYIERYRHGYAYHGVHPLYVWAWGVPAFRHLKKVILVGGRDEDAVRRLGFHPARSMDDALSMARKDVGKDCSITYQCMPPLFVADLGTGAG